MKFSKRNVTVKILKNGVNNFLEILEKISGFSMVSKKIKWNLKAISKLFFWKILKSFRNEEIFNLL